MKGTKISTMRGYSFAPSKDKSQTISLNNLIHLKANSQDRSLSGVKRNEK